MRKFIITSLLILSIISCKNERITTVKNSEIFEISDFQPLQNWHNDTTIVTENGSKQLKYIYIDYTDAIDSGFVIPSKKQTESGQFQYQFQIKNKSSEAQKFYYKIYYQNESYKFPEQDTEKPNIQHFYAHENFYGSWENTDMQFIETQAINANETITITGNIRIVGNPRNEELFFHNNKNDRWKRNPRVGNYSFLLAVVTESNLIQIPEYVQNISKKSDSIFTNPYHYFLFGEGLKLPNLLFIKADEAIKVIAKADLGTGIYASHTRFWGNETKGEYLNRHCNSEEELRKKAHFEQFIHYVDESAKLYNIPVIADVLGDNYSKTDYNWNSIFYKNEERIGIRPQTAPFPCETIISDSIERKIIMHNPKSTFGDWKKQNVGVISRHAFTYGKHTIKANLTELLNDSNVWNGLTNAIWMIYQGGEGKDGWNSRRACTKDGYMENYWGGREDSRADVISYSEIDFEILKTVPYCPSYIFPPVYDTPVPNHYDISNWNVQLPSDVLEADNKITIACTNWDMACPQPENFAAGCNPISYEGKTFESHRWELIYRALTQKIKYEDDLIFGSDYYYFQIDWRPTEIIWRVGPEKDNMEVVGYMNNTVTSIPNNQMLMIITQEFHNTKWWIGSPYMQENIPFPKNDIYGYIYEYTIE